MFEPLDDWGLVRKLIHDSDIKISHRGGDDRLVSDIKESLENCSFAYGDVKDENEYLKEVSLAAEKHINKLEKMLLNRSVRFKGWNTTKEESGYF